MTTFVIAGTQSGVGKSSLALALAAAFRRRGLRVQTFKVGPDYLDPTYLRRASGRPCYNLDGWMCGEAYVKSLFARMSSDADVNLVEGVMGLFDGARPDALDGSTAEIVKWLSAPVLLTVNTHGMGRSIAATVKGYAELEEGVRVAGVIANRCGSDSHATLLSEALDNADMPPLMGAIPRDGFPELPSRHLGLVSANGDNLSETTLNALADAAEQHIHLDEVLQLGQTMLSTDQESCDAGLGAHLNTSPPIRLGVAMDDAFHFYYQDFFDAVEARGGEVVFFSPLNDGQIPDNLDALYFGGGYPEEFARELSANTDMCKSVRAFTGPIYAECGGLMYLTQGMDDNKFVGLLPCKTRLLARRKMLGYVEATLTAPSLWGDTGATLRGHEFHYSELVQSPVGNDGWTAAYSLRRNRDDRTLSEGYCRGNVLASYAHLHFASRPKALDYFLNQCRST